MKKEELFDCLSTPQKLSLILEEIKKENKLYSKQKLIKMCKSVEVKNILHRFCDKENIDRININRKCFVGNAKIIKKIKELLVE